eukprot:526311_1
MTLHPAVTTVFAVVYTLCLVLFHQFFARRLLPINPWISCLFGFVCMIIAPIFIKVIYFCILAYIIVLSIIFIDIYRWSYIQSQLNNDISHNNKFIQFIYKNKNTCNIICYLIFITLIIYDLVFIGISSTPNTNYWSFFNLLCGVILIFTLIIPVNDTWCISQHNSSRKMYSDLTVSVDVLWILLFCSFNLNFMLYSYFEYFLDSLCVIFASILCILITRRTDLWFSSRFYLLGFSTWIRCISGNHFHYLINNGTSLEYKYIPFCNVWSVVNFSLALLYTFYLALYMWIQRNRIMYLKKTKGELLSDIDDQVTDDESSTDGFINNDQQSEANFTNSQDETDSLLDD